MNGAGSSTSIERGYATRVLPRAILRGLGQALRGDGGGALRGAAIIAGLGMAAAGFAVGGMLATMSRAARPAGASR